jgi:type I restriction enzyme, S subunit
MSLQLFFDNFALLADAPNGVLKLRELILRLAVLGKLVPQNATEHHDGEFLNRIGLASRAKEQNLDNLPLGWVRCQLSLVLDVQNGFAFKSELFTESSEGIPLIRIRDLKTSHTTVRYTGSYKEEYMVHRGDYLIGMDGDFSIHLWQGSDALLNQRVCRLRDYSPHVDPSFIGFVIQEKLDEIHRDTSFVTVKHLSSKSIKAITIDLPPLREQQRIVAKIAELMRLCDESEARQKGRRESRVRLNNVTLAPLNNAASLPSEEFEQASTRLADNFATLCDSVETVTKLRSTILQLAVQGKLVPQDPNEEPAPVLFERITKKKEQLIRERKIKTPQSFSPPSESEAPYDLPRGWKWVRLSDVFDVRDGTHDTPKYVSDGIPLVTSKNLYTGLLDLSNVKYISESDHRQIAQRSKVDRNDILFAMIGSIGNPVIVDIDCEFSIKNVALFKYFSIDLSEPNYLRYFLVAASDQMREESAGGVQSFVSLTFLRKYLFPLPPLEEQERIVAKVNQLMTLCDELETKLRQVEADSKKLMNAAVQHVLAFVTTTTNKAQSTSTH